MYHRKHGLSRREFLQTGAMAAVAAGIAASHAGEQKMEETKPDPKKIRNFHPDMRYRRLGNTDVYVSVISLGGIGIEKSVIQYAIEQGVNFVHTSNQYNHGNSIRLLGEVLKTNRDRVYVALKDTFSVIDDDLKTLNTDHVDFIMFNRHSASDVTHPEIFEDFAGYKKQGKALYAGLTSHGNIKECVAAGVQCGQYAIIQPTLNQNAFDAMQSELKQANEKGVGIVGMKTMQGINDRDLELANLKKLLSNPAVVTVNRVLKTFDHVNAYLKAAKEILSAQEDMSLYRYARLNRSKLCMMCGACENACPQGISISSVLRSKYYYADELADRETAVAAFRESIENKAHPGNCAVCGKCESACPNGLAIVKRLERALRFFDKLSA